MVKFFFFLLLALNLVSCQEGAVKNSTAEKLTHDRTQFLMSSNSKKSPGIISGQVLNLSDDSAIKGALVIIKRGRRIITTAMTDARGFFKVTGLPQSTYKVTALKDDFSEMSFDSIALDSGKEVVTHFILTPVTKVEYVRLSYSKKPPHRGEGGQYHM